MAARGVLAAKGVLAARRYVSTQHAWSINVCDIKLSSTLYGLEVYNETGRSGGGEVWPLRSKSEFQTPLQNVCTDWHWKFFIVRSTFGKDLSSPTSPQKACISTAIVVFSVGNAPRDSFLSDLTGEGNSYIFNEVTPLFCSIDTLREKDTG